MDPRTTLDDLEQRLRSAARRLRRTVNRATGRPSSDVEVIAIERNERPPRA